MFLMVSPSLTESLHPGEDHRVEPVNTGAVLTLTRKSQIPDMVLIDIDSPGCFNILSGFREYFPGSLLPVYGILGRPDPKLRNLFTAAGGSGFLTSPDEIFGIGTQEREIPSLLPLSIDFSEKETNRRLLKILESITVKSEVSTIPLRTEILSKTIHLLLKKLMDMTQINLAVVLLHRNSSVDSFVLPSVGIVREDYDDFLGFCLNDFYQTFRGADLENPEETLFAEDAAAFNRIKISPHKISSYCFLPLNDITGEPIGSIHLGHLSNNFFKGEILAAIESYVKQMEYPLLFSLRNTQNVIKQEKVFNIFSKFVPPEIIPGLIEQELEKGNQSVQKKEITLLFSDIRSFTTITEKNSAQEVVNFLNRHFEAMVAIIRKYGGTIDKFIGDAIVAIFGLTEGEEDHSLCGVKAAREMIARVGKVDCSTLVLDGSRYNIGIGLHRGEAIIGNIGSPAKSAFTAIGDVIGTAEELEGITKVYKKSILFSGEIARLIRTEIPIQEILKPEEDEEWPDGLYSPREVET